MTIFLNIFFSWSISIVLKNHLWTEMLSTCKWKKSRIRTNCLFYGFRLTAEKHLRFYKLLHQPEHYLKNETMSYLHFCSVSHILRAGVHNYLDVNVKWELYVRGSQPLPLLKDTILHIQLFWVRELRNWWNILVTASLQYAYPMSRTPVFPDLKRLISNTFFNIKSWFIGQ